MDTPARRAVQVGNAAGLAVWSLAGAASGAQGPAFESRLAHASNEKPRQRLHGDGASWCPPWAAY